MYFIGYGPGNGAIFQHYSQFLASPFLYSQAKEKAKELRKELSEGDIFIYKLVRVGRLPKPGKSKGAGRV